MAEALSPQVLSTLIGSIYPLRLGTEPAGRGHSPRVHRRGAGRARRLERDGCCLRSDTGRDTRPREPARRSNAGGDRRRPRHRRNHGKDSSQEHLPEDRRLPPGRPDPVLEAEDPAYKAGGALKAGANSPKCLAVLAASFSGCGAEDSFQALEKKASRCRQSPLRLLKLPKLFLGQFQTSIFASSA